MNWTKSTRSSSVILIIGLLYLVVILSFVLIIANKDSLPEVIISLVSMAFGSVVTAYFGKRDAKEDRELTDP